MRYDVIVSPLDDDAPHVISTPPSVEFTYVTTDVGALGACDVLIV
jgi:hypothetical protein